MKHMWNDRAVRLTLLYVVIASAWMLLTNQLLAHLTHNLRLLGWLDTYNAWFFIAFTAPVLYLERRQADRGLKLLATIVTASDDAILSGTLDGRITSWNRGAEAIYGHAAGEAVGRPLSLLLDEDEGERAALDEVLTRIGRGERIRHLEALHRRKSGETVDIALSVSPLTGPAGRVTGLCAVGRDVTRHRQAERALRMAEVGKLASGLVHEIRNPLNAMRMQVAVIRGKLRQMTDGGEGLAAQILESLDQEVLRIERLASEFLAYGRPVSDRAETIEPSAIVQDLAEFVRPELAGNGIEVVTEDAPEMAALRVKMDESKLRQVLLNLLENARQAMPEGGRLTLGCARDPRAGVKIRVADSGGGIPPENLDRVFDAFFSTKSAGTGLGLAIVKQTVEAAGGRIRVDSRTGEGTCFEISLPLAIEAGAAPEDADGPPDARPMGDEIS
jgi:PAS domain S-box-containing protein